jgi:hypothetical protein
VAEERNKSKDLVRKFQGKRLIGRPWHRWEDNIKIDVKVARCLWLMIGKNCGLWRT